MATATWFVIKHFKKGQGTSWFLNLMYWHMPDEISRVLFNKTPSSTLRHWLA